MVQAKKLKEQVLASMQLLVSTADTSKSQPTIMLSASLIFAKNKVTNQISLSKHLQHVTPLRLGSSHHLTNQVSQQHI